MRCRILGLVFFDFISKTDFFLITANKTNQSLFLLIKKITVKNLKIRLFCNPKVFGFPDI